MNKRNKKQIAETCKQDTDERNKESNRQRGHKKEKIQKNLELKCQCISVANSAQRRENF
jgi:hypothetical protein